MSFALPVEAGDTPETRPMRAQWNRNGYIIFKLAASDGNPLSKPIKTAQAEAQDIYDGIRARAPYILDEYSGLHPTVIPLPPLVPLLRRPKLPLWNSNVVLWHHP